MRRSKSLTLRFTPQGHLVLDVAEDAPELELSTAERIERAFTHGAGYGLLRLGAAEVGSVLPPVFAYWRDLGARFVTALCMRPFGEEQVEAPAAPPDSELEAIAASAPPMPGSEYVTAVLLRALWGQIGEAFVEWKFRVHDARRVFRYGGIATARSEH